MKHRLFLLLVLFCVCAGSFAADVIVQDRSGWYPGPAEAQKIVLQVQPDTELVDLSIRTAGGFGMVTRREYPEGIINQEFTDQALTGFLDGTAEHGFAVEFRESAALGPLSGFRIITNGSLNGTHFVATNWLLFTQRELYTVSAYDLGDAKNPNAIASEYSSRIQFSPSIRPLIITAHSAKGPGYEAGRLTAYILFFALLGVILAIFFRLHRSRDS